MIFFLSIIPNDSLEEAVVSHPLQWDWFWCSRYRQRVALRPDAAPLVLYNCKQIHITKPHFREPLSEHFLVSRELDSKIHSIKIKISDFSFLLSLQILRLKHKTSILPSCPLTPQDIGTGICELCVSQTLTLSFFWTVDSELNAPYKSKPKALLGIAPTTSRGGQVVTTVDISIW